MEKFIHTFFAWNVSTERERKRMKNVEWGCSTAEFKIEKNFFSLFPFILFALKRILKLSHWSKANKILCLRFAKPLYTKCIRKIRFKKKKREKILTNRQNSWRATTTSIKSEFQYNDIPFYERNRRILSILHCCKSCFCFEWKKRRIIINGLVIHELFVYSMNHF